MPFYISPKTFKQQAKMAVQHWPFDGAKTTKVRNILSQLYGYKSHHHYQKLLTEQPSSLIPLDKPAVMSHYPIWVKKLAVLGPMNQIQSRNLIHKLWTAYLGEKTLGEGKPYQANFVFVGECADFLAEEYLREGLNYSFDDQPSIKDSIEAIGTPHPEVAAVSVNGTWVDFSYLLQDGDKVQVYPHPAPREAKALPYKPTGDVSFLLDVHLGALARYLRMAGFNCLFESKDYGDAILAEVAANEDHILLTRDIGLLKRGKVKYARWVRNVQPEEQFKEIVRHYQLYDEFKPMSRCVKCNGKISSVEKTSVSREVPEGVYDWVEEFRRCDDCLQVYWKGSHFEKIQEILDSVKHG